MPASVSHVETAPATGWVAYNDCVYDPTQALAAEAPGGRLVHYIAPNVTTYNIGNSSQARHPVS
jgi:hypothetical protein